MQYWLNYCLNIKPGDKIGSKTELIVPKPQFKADQGNCIHKALELLARQKVAIQNNEPKFREDEISREWDVQSFSAEDAFVESWNFYSKVRAKHWDWTSKEHKKLRGWFYDTLSMNGGMWNPLNRTVIQPEQFFDITFDQPWAAYSYQLPNGEWIKGQLAIKGTMDLVTEEDSETLSYVDWKSGMRKDWATGKPKDWKKLRDDPQMRMYHYALSKLYPERKYIIMTVVWIQDGGAFSLDFGPKDLPKTEKMIRDRFETIKGCERPPRILNDPANPGKFKCIRLCTYGMTNWEGTDKTVCDHMHNEVVTLGMSRATAKYAQGGFGNYGSGGGVENRDKLEKPKENE